MISFRRSALASLLLVSAIVLGLTGCAPPVTPTDTTQVPPSGEPTETTEAQGDEMYTPKYRPNGEETAEFTTSKGTFTAQLYGTDAPIHVGNFVELVQAGFYEDTKFHRYIEGFVIQGGDPDTKEASVDEVAAEGAKPDGQGMFGKGGPGYNIKGEFDPATNPQKHVKGALAMARAQSPDSAGSQFYITLEELPQLDGAYTVFGAVTEGMDVVESLRPGDTIEKIELSGLTE